MAQSEILLESGTNEVEILEFEVGNSVYGINIAKVIEITTAQSVTQIPSSGDEVEGVFVSRGVVVPVINLYEVTHEQPTEKERAMFIVCNFNKMTVAFHVGNVRGIQRISWDDIKTPPAIANSGNHRSAGLLTGITEIEEHLIMILDFEKIVTEINSSTGLDVENIESLATSASTLADKHLVVADDSAFLNKMIVDALTKTGFTNIKSFPDGEAAWEYIQSQRDGDGEITDRIACVVSDIEMPKMDGHHLTKRIKSDAVLKKIPVFLFSSLINEQMILKGKSVGADGQFSKPEISDLIDALLKLLKK